MRAATGDDRARLASQVENLYRRALLIQRAIIFSTVSLLCAAVLIITLFFTALMKMESAVIISILFICCLASLIASLIAFIMDIRLSLKALKLELGSGAMGSAI
jgi:Cu/Ag efflux pump CusA